MIWIIFLWKRSSALRLSQKLTPTSSLTPIWLRPQKLHDPLLGSRSLSIEKCWCMGGVGSLDDACQTFSLTLCPPEMSFNTESSTFGKFTQTVFSNGHLCPQPRLQAEKTPSSASSATPYLALCDRGAAATVWLFFFSVSRLCPSATLRPLHKTTETMRTSLSPRHGLHSLTRWHTSHSRRVALSVRC